jgi:hypothetical protein
MYSEIRLSPEINLAIQQKVKAARAQDPRSAFSAIWDRVRKDNPELFGKLEAKDRQADEREAKQLTLAEHKALFALERLNQIKLERPKKVEATQQKSIICVDGFSNPLF